MKYAVEWIHQQLKIRAGKPFYASQFCPYTLISYCKFGTLYDDLSGCKNTVKEPLSPRILCAPSGGRYKIAQLAFWKGEDAMGTNFYASLEKN